MKLRKNEHMGRPRLKPDPLKIAEDFIINSKSFNQKAWSLHENWKNAKLSGEFIIHRKIKGETFIPFTLFFPQRSDDPRKEVNIELPYTGRVRYLNREFNIKEKILEAYEFKINKMTARIYKTNFAEEEAIPKNEYTEQFTKGELRNLLRAHTLEYIPLLDTEGNETGEIMVTDHEGKFKTPLKPNIKATDLWWVGRMTNTEYQAHSSMLNIKGSVYLQAHEDEIDWIAGDVLICHSRMLKLKA